MTQGFFIGRLVVSLLCVSDKLRRHYRYVVSLARLDRFLVVYGLAYLANIKKLTNVSFEELGVFSLDHFEQSR